MATKEQELIVKNILDTNVIVDCVAGSGKCHAINTPIIMFDGSVKMVQDIVVGDLLMGPDSKSRTVLSLGRGTDTMYKVFPKNGGEQYVFNSEHVLSLKYTNKVIYNSNSSKWTLLNSNNVFDTKIEAENFLELNKNVIINISINSYLRLPYNLRKNFKLYRSGVKFDYQSIDIDPYILGLLYGTRTIAYEKNKYQLVCIKNRDILFYLKDQLYKYNCDIEYSGIGYNYKIFGIPEKYHNLNKLPENYKINVIDIRLKLLAGILDSNLDISFSDPMYNELIDDIKFLIRSLGLYAYKKLNKIIICGNIEEIPYINKRVNKFFKLIRKDSEFSLTSKFYIKRKKEDTYYGFTLDGDHRYLLGDFTVTHNTTTSLYIAETYKDKNILLLTYNKRLKLETRTRLKKEHKALEVHSFHSYAVNYYNKNAHTDSELANVILKNTTTSCPKKYDIIIVDEAQDLTILYLKLVKKIIADSSKKETTLCVLGDQKQSIYCYNGSDQRYLKYIDKLLLPDAKWIRLSLSETFRLTINNTKFLNGILSNYESEYIPIVTNKKVLGSIRHVTTNCFKDGPYKEVLYYVSIKKLAYIDIMVIAPSLKKGPVSVLSNKLTSLGIPVHYPTSDSEEIDNTLTKNKILFCTMHQSKGLERKAIILFNFDESYIMYNKNSNSSELSNEMYVALTRSSLYMSLLRHSTNENLKFFENNSRINNGVVDYIVYDNYKKTNKKDNTIGENPKLSVTSIIKYVTYDIIDEIVKHIESVEIIRPGLELNLVTKVYQKKLDIYEQVSEISGTAIPAYYEFLKTGTTTIFELEKSNYSGKKFKTFKYSNEEAGYAKFTKEPEINISSDMFLEPESEKLESGIQNLESISETKNLLLKKDPMETFQKILYLSNKFLAISSGVDAKMQQIENYNWISKENLDICMARMSNVVSLDTEYEVMCEGTMFKKDIAGYIDAIDHKNKIIYEFKCTQNIEKSHLVQVFLYLILNETCSRYKDYKYRIFNIRTGQIIEISKKKTSTDEQINTSLKNLLSDKLIMKSEDFLKNTLKLLN